MTATYEVIIVGSGAGGSAAAYRLAESGVRTLLIERGPVLPGDGSTLDVGKVIRQGLFKDGELWRDRTGRKFQPSEYANLGGKTKWYGAALDQQRADTAFGQAIGGGRAACARPDDDDVVSAGHVSPQSRSRDKGSCRRRRRESRR